jgi:hypothetical protein
MAETHFCTGCQTEKPLNENHFHRNANAPMGFVTRCKDCTNAYQQERRRRIRKLKHPEEDQGNRTCKQCKETKSLNNKHFSRNKDSRGGFNLRCKTCIAEYYQNNKEQMDTTCRAWKAANPDKVKGYRLKQKANARTS